MINIVWNLTELIQQEFMKVNLKIGRIQIKMALMNYLQEEGVPHYALSACSPTAILNPEPQFLAWFSQNSAWWLG